MLQCHDCEFFREGPGGAAELGCNPFTNIKEPECIAKWQLYQLTTIAKSHEATLAMYRRLAPLQEKMFQHMEREIDEADEADSWKNQPEDDEADDDPFRL